MFTEWQYYTIRAIGKLVQKLSYPTVVRWGRKLGPLVSRIMKKQYNRAVFQAVRGLECSETEARQIVDELFRNLGQSALEILYTPNLNAGNIAEYVTLDHPERLDEALKEDKGVIILTGHIGNWEWLGALALYGYPASTIVKNQVNSSVTRLLNENREGMGLEVFARGGNEMIIAARALRRKKLLGFLADQDGGFHGVPQPFLGKMSSTPKGPAMFAQKFHSPIVPVFTIHDDQHRTHLAIGEIMHFEDTGNKDEDIARMTRKMAVITENFIKEHPTEWLWFQHRWSTEPEEIIALQKEGAATDCESKTNVDKA